MDAGSLAGVFEYYDQPTAIIDIGQQRSTFTYDSSLLLATSADSAGRSTIYTRNARGQVTEVKLVAGGTDQSKRQWAYSTTYPGFVTKYTQFKMASDPTWLVDQVATYGADTSGRISTTVVDTSLKLTTTYGYDGNGNVKTVKNPLNATTTYTRNDAGRITRVERPAPTTGAMIKRGGCRLSMTKKPPPNFLPPPLLTMTSSATWSR